MMAPIARSSLAQLLNERSIESVQIDPVTVGHLQTQARNHLALADHGIDLDPEGAFSLAYDACRKMCDALVLASGHRAIADKGHHKITFETAAALADQFRKRKLIVEAEELRFVRHDTQYRADQVAREDVVDAIAIGRDLIEAFAGPIERLLSPHL